MKVKVLLFGVLAEKAGKSVIEVEKVKDLDALLKHIYSHYPEMESLSFQVSHNHDLVTENVVFKNGDEVALLPPFAGG